MQQLLLYPSPFSGRVANEVSRVGLTSPPPDCSLALAATLPFQGRDKKAYALALGRADTAACQRFTFVSSSGTTSFGTFMKSMVTCAVMSAIE